MTTLSTLKKLALDMVPVFLAVFLAYQVNEYRDYRKEQEDLQEAIKNIRLELLTNKKEADTSAMYHADMVQRMLTVKHKSDSGLLKPYSSFMSFLVEIAPKKRNLVIPRLSEISYETAKRKHALSSMDYETVNKISGVYVNINEGLKTTQGLLLQAVSDADVIAMKNFDQTFHIVFGFISELHAQEKYLSKQIDMALEHLEEKFPTED